MSEARTITSRQRLVRFGIWAAPILLLLTLCSWALSSPAGSSPDDNFHVASIWCAYGEREGLCEQSDKDESERLVPSAIAYMTCFAFDDHIGGTCQHGMTEDLSTELAPITHGNWNGATYPPLFYALFGMFASQNIAVSIIAIRLINAFIATTLLTLTAFALPRKLRPMLVVSSAVAFMPLGLSIIPSTNPSSWALISAAIVFPAVFALGETTGRRRLVLATLACIAAVMGAGARADSAVYAIFSVLLALLLSATWNRVTVLVGATVIVASAAFYLSAGQTSAVSGLTSPGAESVEATSGSLRLLAYNLLHLPELWLGMFTNLGWLDTQISPLAVFAMIVATISILFTALARLSKKKALALVSTCTALTVLPLYIFHTSNAAVGTQVQARYILPLLVILLAVALSPSPDSPVFSSVQVWILTIGIICAHALALYDQMTRYTAGDRVADLEGNGWWWGGSPLPASASFLLGAVAFAVLLGVLAMNAQRRSFTELTTTRDRTSHRAS